MEDRGRVSSAENAPLLSPDYRNGMEQSPPGVSPIVHEDDDTITIRRPVQYYSINRHPDDQGDSRMRGTQHRYRYYSRLAPHRHSLLLMPNHIVPPEYYLVIPIKPEEGTQSSIVTIFSIWNTMMGTSILSMPWALERAGFSMGIVLMVVMALLTLYTAIRVLQSPHSVGGPTLLEDFSDVCQHYLGQWGRYLSVGFSLVALLGAAVVYWVLMANFLYHTGKFIFDKVSNEYNTTDQHPLGNQTIHDVYCPSNADHQHSKNNLSRDTFELLGNASTHYSVFESIWHQTHTVPFFLLVILVPLLNFKSPTFFTKFNALGTVSVIYILTFIAVKASQWGLNLDFSAQISTLSIPQFQWTFPALTGTLSLAFFIHNCVLSITRNQQKPENNVRDVSIAYFCVAFTYLFIGVVFYICFPLPKNCIEDNLLNNFRSLDIMAFAARLFLLFQMVTVFPLLMYIFRAQTLSVVFGDVYPSLKHVLVVNAAVLVICLVFSVLYPKIGTIIRFAGALCGAAYIFTLPCVVYLLSQRQAGTLSTAVIIIHVLIIVIGVVNFFAQFVILGKD